MKFHNGDALTSEDVKFTFERMVDLATRSPWISIFSVIKAIDTPDPRRSSFASPIRFRRSSTILPRSNIPRSSAAKTSSSAVISSRVADGTGPFMLEDFRPNSLIRLKRNPDYYEPGLPYLDGLDFRIIPDEGSRMAALRAGSVQLTWLGRPIRLTQMRDVPDIVATEPEILFAAAAARIRSAQSAVQ